MTQLADTTAPAREMRNLRILIGLAVASTLVAILAGVVISNRWLRNRAAVDSDSDDPPNPTQSD